MFLHFARFLKSVASFFLDVSEPRLAAEVVKRWGNHHKNNRLLRLRRALSNQTYLVTNNLILCKARIGSLGSLLVYRRVEKA